MLIKIIWLEVFTPRLPVRTSPPCEGLGGLPPLLPLLFAAWCCRRNASHGIGFNFRFPSLSVGSEGFFIVTGRHKPEGVCWGFAIKKIKDALSSVWTHPFIFLSDEKELGDDWSSSLPNYLQWSCEDKRTDNPIRKDTAEVTQES